MHVYCVRSFHRMLACPLIMIFHDLPDSDMFHLKFFMDVFRIVVSVRVCCYLTNVYIDCVVDFCMDVFMVCLFLLTFSFALPL